VLFARSVEGISFSNNSVTRSTRFEPYHNRKFTFSFEACKAINIANNTFSDDVLGKNIQLKWTEKSELRNDPVQKLDVKESK
jgi:hypothetical protein